MITNAYTDDIKTTNRLLNIALLVIILLLLGVGISSLFIRKKNRLLKQKKDEITATFDQNGKHYLLQVRKVYPEVRDGRFRIDFVFKGVRPGNIRTGQTYYVDLQLGQSKQAIIIPKGTFYSVTGGQWIFVLDKSGKKAYRRKITIGRQNPQYYEVIEGLEPGEQVIVSGYEAYKDNDVLVFN